MAGHSRSENGVASARRTPRHCERSEAIHASAREIWIASSLALLAMTMTHQGWARRVSNSRHFMPCILNQHLK
jgi:hypothetical protein